MGGTDYDFFDEEFDNEPNTELFPAKEKGNEEVEEETFDDDLFDDIDFSEFAGNFRSGMKKINRSLKARKKKPGKKNIPVTEHAKVHGKAQRKLGKVIVPRDYKVIIEGVNDFILSKDPAVSFAKSIGYYKGRKLKELLFTINNNSAIPFTIELFNPSAPLDYLQTTSQNLNNRIDVAGNGIDNVTYSDVLFNLLANPTMIPNAKFMYDGPLMAEQRVQALYFKNKNIEGKQKVQPFQLSQQIDIDQYMNDIIYFDIMSGLNRPFIPDGMDVVEYTVLPGMNVTFCFYFEQVSLKKYFFKEAAANKKLM